MYKLPAMKLIVSLMLVALAACGGRQPVLEENQTVAQAPTPEVAKNSTASIQWRASSAGSKNGGANFTPAVQGDNIYVASRNGRVEGFSLATGDNIFSAKLDASLVSGVGANASSIIASTSTGTIIALDINDASEKWRHEVGRSISAAPAANDQLVVIRTIDGHIIGLNAVTGEQIWALERPVAALSVGQDAPSLLAGEGVVSGFSSGRVLVNNIYNGSTFWEKRAFRPSGKNEIERLIDIDAQPVLAGQTVLIGAFKGGVIAYNLRDGEEIWRNEAAATRKIMAVSEGLLAITGPQSQVSLHELTTGNLNWQSDELLGHGLTEPVLTENALIVGTLDGDLYFFDLSNGDISSRLSIGRSAITALFKVGQGIIAYSANSGALSLIQP